MKFFIKCLSVEENTYEIEAGSREEAEDIFNQEGGEYVNGSNKILSEVKTDIYIEAEE